MAFARQPVLTGARLTLRPLTEADWEAFRAIASDPLVWAQHPSHDRWQPEILRAYFEAALERGGALAIIERASGALIGSSQFGPAELDCPGELEMGWSFLARTHWGQGYNREFKALMIGHALHHYSRVVFQVGSENTLSRRAMANIGATLTDRTRTYERSGAMVTHVIYEFTRESFAAGPLASGG
ncbi:GNAT family N-acetyltransferase [Novosphingobium sp. 1949]|uniref:GNAT family N-acetyltransferase n=1 Tax=Novosphingobium organovorum TaxID=2930092 RepID=A0ABT0BFU9_9SPHN|nr:GNAT family N-acetyltransferase [Novosphingobium organovorum]MCJ2183905.1 GNAT family N-acetyltransferase [Novosphingobium organovorum]